MGYDGGKSQPDLAVTGLVWLAGKGIRDGEMAKDNIAATEIELKYLLGQALDAKAVTEVLSREKLSFKLAKARLKKLLF